MSWLSDIVEPVGKFISDNSNWLKPVASAGLGYYAIKQQGKFANKAIDLEKAAADQRYQNALARSGGGGGGGGGINKKKLIQAYKEAMKKEQEGYQAALARYKPFTDASLQILPQQVKTFEDANKNISMLNAYLMTPQRLAQMDQSVPAYTIDIPLPDYIKGK